MARLCAIAAAIAGYMKPSANGIAAIMTRDKPPLTPSEIQCRRGLLFKLHKQVQLPEEGAPQPIADYRTVSPGFARDFQTRAARSLDRPSLAARRKILFF